MEPVINKTNPVKSFITRHKTAITVVATSTVWFALQRHAVKEHDEFLKEKGLYDEYYTPSDEEMGI